MVRRQLSVLNVPFPHFPRNQPSGFKTRGRLADAWSQTHRRAPFLTRLPAQAAWASWVDRGCPCASVCPWPRPTWRPWACTARPHTRRRANLRPPRRESQWEDQLVQAVLWRWVLRGPKPLPVLLAEATGRAVRCQQLSITPTRHRGTSPAPGPDAAWLQELLTGVPAAFLQHRPSDPFLDVEPVGYGCIWLF